MSYEPKMLDTVKTLLASEKGNWPEIANQAGVNYKAIANLMQGASREPGVNTVERLYRCLTDRAEVFKTEKQAIQ